MKTRIGLFAIAAVAASLALAGCSGGAGSGDSPSASTGTVGSWGADKAGEPSVTIAADGAFNGTDGCNSVSGQGTFAGDGFTFGPMVSTMMACEGVDTWLSKADTAAVQDGELVVLDASGAQIGTLEQR